jgi:hypothetical protein
MVREMKCSLCGESALLFKFPNIKIGFCYHCMKNIIRMGSRFIFEVDKINSMPSGHTYVTPIYQEEDYLHPIMREGYEVNRKAESG